MKKILKIVSAAGLVGASLMFAGCGGGGDDTYYPIASNVVINPNPIIGGVQKLSATSNSGHATAVADEFQLTNPTTASYDATIDNGFKYGTDKIAVPAGSALPTALAGGVNDGPADGAVKLTWSAATGTVSVNLTQLDATTEAALQSNAANAQAIIYKTYTP